MGVDGIDLKYGFTISNLPEAGLNKKMISTAHSVAILADSTKFGRRGIAKICDFDEVKYVITDSKVSKENVLALEEMGIKVIIA